MTSDEWAPPGIDTNKPSIARVYDYMLGGKDNFAVDRQTGQLALQITPDGREAARANRSFLRKVVKYLASEVGIRQFLDIGSGLPTVGNVHEIAQSVDAASRVVYVDIDPIVLAHARALLGTNEVTTVIQADVRSPEDILSHPQVRKHINFDEPLGLLMFGILHHLSDEENPGAVAATMRNVLAPGSHLAISHFCDPGEAQPEASKKALVVEKIFNQTLGTGRWRTHDEVLSYFGDFEMLEPGLVPLAEWRTEEGEVFNQPDTHYTFIGGLARKS